MKKTKLLLRIIPVFLFSSSILVLKAQIPAAIDTKMKSDNMRNFQLEEIKVRWKKAALENCPGVPCVPPVCPTSTVTDVDGNIYNTVAIGTQCWTKENLKVTKYDDGTAIPDQTSISPSSNWGTLQTGARTDYTGATGIPSGQTYVSTYGYLYNWYAVKGIATAGSTTYKNICPTGWHVPTDAELSTLESYLNTVAPTGSVGGKMKSMGTTLWNSPNTDATDASGFSALPGGFRSTSGSFSSIRNYAFFWSATESVGSTSGFAWYRSLSTSSSIVGRNINEKVGASVRCLRD
jgi:uncharacterized protein (TIGR02145 family)